MATDRKRSAEGRLAGGEFVHAQKLKDRLGGGDPNTANQKSTRYFGPDGPAGWETLEPKLRKRFGADSIRYWREHYIARKTLKDIGKERDISRQRVQQIIKDVNDAIGMDAMGNDIWRLSSRAQRVLHGQGIGHRIHLAGYNFDRLLYVKGCGKNTLQEILAWASE